MKKKHQGLWSLLFLGPHMILFILFFLIPAVFGIYIAFTDWDLFGTPQWVGFNNFKEILFDSKSIYHTQFMNGTRNTILFVIFTVPLCVIVPLVIATMIQAKPKLYKLFQSLFYLPTLFAVSAVMLVWSFLLSLSYGPLPKWFGLKINITSTQPWAWVALVLITVWWCVGQNLIIYVAALNGVPVEQVEAARIDGAGNFTIFMKILMPNIRFPLFFTLVTTTIAQFNVYGQPLMLTNGGPNNSTRVLMMDIQNNAFGAGIPTAGMASAMAVLLGLLIMLVSVVQFVVMRRQD
ncbi:carbohydrate ABC transporter permease [Bifidobacterium biavatii]|uniref:ABC transporter, permease protein n=1 Tax=Bifidobacterium biavatii DSM 23969 TaxID=1437608 RepID=A0A086ZLU1_9BIFI|nr:sugar ABC transporter permease [Bifidobacterium biavatii]KFI47491.1 ABC transporter, permease protein [Bifidobacterium biavatii DSM 23969]